MNEHHAPTQRPEDATGESNLVGRRRFLKVLAGAAGAAAAVPLVGSFRSGGSGSAATTRTSPAAARPTSLTEGSTNRPAQSGGRILVAVQLAGGNDGLNTVVPVNDARYAPLRGRLALTPDDLTMLDGDYGLHAMPRLARAWKQGNLAIVHGVGVPDPNLSHFASMDIWLRGSTDPGASTGWIGRALDGLGGDADPLVGISIGEQSPALWSSRVVTASLPAGEGILPWSPLDRDEHGAAHKAVSTLAESVPGESHLASQVRAGHRQALAIGDRVGPIVDRSILELDDHDVDRMDGEEGDETGGELATQLAVVADLIKADVPTRAFHVSQGGYDTHDQQAEDHPYLLGNLDAAIDRFLTSLGPRRADVVVMTYSEFGRRPPANGSGTDHGTASVAMVVGDAVKGGHYGEPVDLTRLGDDDNLRTTTDFRDYLGGVAGSVLDVDPRDIAAGTGRPITVV